ncbi:EutN/CcmL family microcompartment protein [Pelagicoccus sp. SDUM812005]|uniref:EutN/CcmL family microcompartment protein n=1 Tax=Pelagicoccus sp. SDUM812005 TaxID=3041257 RepID=UPI00280E738D|nr:EutN/CcmL family microcompartment protein [Pelagicoccus sp. SDUM812005]MDQ8180022.1 EutN/CcmL family microcompartment protein [Pelagicoccus sp. SDUM812005]
MILGQIVGNVTSAVCHPGLDGIRMLLCEVLDSQGQGTGRIIGTADWIGAGDGDTVLINADGDAVQVYAKNPEAPLRNVVMGIVDELEGKGA